MELRLNVLGTKNGTRPHGEGSRRHGRRSDRGLLLELDWMRIEGIAGRGRIDETCDRGRRAGAVVEWRRGGWRRRAGGCLGFGFSEYAASDGIIALS